MELLQIARKIWRYRLVTLPVLIFTLLALCVIVIKGPEYSATSSYVLINPPGPPTALDTARDPALKRINPENPYTRLADQSAIVGVLSRTLNNESTRQALSEAGAGGRYTVAPSPERDYSRSLVEITGVGSNEGEAVRTAELVGAALTRELDSLQVSQGVAPRYRIGTQRVVAPDQVEQQVSGTLRSLVGVLIVGAILLFLVVSVAEALATLRAQRSMEGTSERDGTRESGAEVDEAAPTGNSRGESVAGTGENGEGKTARWRSSSGNRTPAKRGAKRVS